MQKIANRILKYYLNLVNFITILDVANLKLYCNYTLNYVETKTKVFLLYFVFILEFKFYLYSNLVHKKQ